MKQITLEDKHLAVTGKVLQLLRQEVSPYDSQIIVMLISLYLCHQYEMNPDEYTTHINNNMKAVGKNTDFLLQTLNTIHQNMKTSLYIHKGSAPTKGKLN